MAQKKKKTQKEKKGKEKKLQVRKVNGKEATDEDGTIFTSPEEVCFLHLSTVKRRGLSQGVMYDGDECARRYHVWTMRFAS